MRRLDLFSGQGRYLASSRNGPDRENAAVSVRVPLSSVNRSIQPELCRLNNCLQIYRHHKNILSSPVTDAHSLSPAVRSGTWKRHCHANLKHLRTVSPNSVYLARLLFFLSSSVCLLCLWSFCFWPDLVVMFFRLACSCSSRSCLFFWSLPLFVSRKSCLHSGIWESL